MPFPSIWTHTTFIHICMYTRTYLRLVEPQLLHEPPSVESAAVTHRAVGHDDEAPALLLLLLQLLLGPVFVGSG